jgi:hypothetical protein
MSEWNPSQYTLDKIDIQTKVLIESFDRYLAKFKDSFSRDETFGGPSLYFHFQCISQFGSLPIIEKLQSDRFIEYIYAVLVSWGMHRMGNTATKLGSFREFKHEITSQTDNLIALGNYKIWEMKQEDSAKVIHDLRNILDTMRISKSESHLVANTKVLHHILPNLVPPVDRRYTLAFFGINTILPGEKTAGSIFKHLYPAFFRVSSRLQDKIIGDVSLSSENWNTSFTKVIDNAIIGAMLE